MTYEVEMNKAELLAAIADAPDDTIIYVVTPDGIGRSNIEAEFGLDEQGFFIYIGQAGIEPLQTAKSEERTSAHE